MKQMKYATVSHAMSRGINPLMRLIFLFKIFRIFSREQKRILLLRPIPEKQFPRCTFMERVH